MGSWMAPSVRPRAEPRLRRHLRHLAGAEVHAGWHTRTRHLYHNSTLALDGDTGEIRLVLPAPERPLGPRPPVRAAARRHRGGPRPRRRELDQPAARGRRDAEGGDRHPRQDRGGLHPRPRDRRVPVGDADHRRRTSSATSTARPERCRRTRRLVFTAEGQEVLRLSARQERREGLGGGRLQSPDQHDVHAAAQRLRADAGDTTFGRHPGPTAEPLRPLRHRLRHQIAPGTDQVGHGAGDLGRDRRDTSGTTSSARPPCRWWRPAGGLVFGGDVERAVPGLRPRDRRGAVGDQPRLAGERASRSATPSTGASTWRSAPARPAPPRASSG